MGGGPDFQTISTSISTAIGIAKAILNADRALDKADLKLQLADLMGELATARVDLAHMQDVIFRLGDEISELQKKLEFAGSMQFEAPYYWNASDGKKDGPFCATCWDGRGRLAIRLYEELPGHWKCHTCKNDVQDARGQANRFGEMPPR